jgi:hypothetical protein
LPEISRAFDDDEHVLTTSNGLNHAFDLDLFIKRLIKSMQTIGLPDDIIKLITAWLKNKKFFVSTTPLMISGSLQLF